MRRTLALTGLGSLLAVVLVACGDDGGGSSDQSASTDPGVDVADLSPTIDNTYVAFASVTRAVYEGNEVDEDTGESVDIRVVSEPRAETTTVGGTEVTIVDVADFEDGEKVEQTEDYYAQSSDGVVYYMGETVDDIEDGEVVGHEGQWQAGVDGAQAGVFMPADPAVGDEFEQERAPGVAEDESTVVRSGITVEVSAGTFENCIKTEDYDPIGDVTEFKFYCPDVGLIREQFPAGGSLDLVELEVRS
jgi:hypothetical protein